MHDYLGFLLRAGEYALRFGAVGLAAGLILLGLIYTIFRLRGGRPGTFPKGRAVAGVLLAGYLMALVYLTVLRLGGGSGMRAVNLHLFRGWREAWNGCNLQDFLNVVLNIGAFVPLGLLLPLLGEGVRRWWASVGLGLCTSLAVETAQYLTGRGIFDVDDLLTNTLGCFLGYTLTMGVLALGRRDRRGWGATGYFACPLALLLAFAGAFGYYQWKDYGNLPSAPAYTAFLGGMEWEEAVPLPEEGDRVPVCWLAPLDRAACDALAGQLGRLMGTAYPDVSVYDHLIHYANHSTGDFLSVNDRDGTYQVKRGVTSDGPLCFPDRETLADLLAAWGIEVPPGAELTVEDRDSVFTAGMEPVGEDLVHGTLRVRCQEGEAGPELVQVENRLLRFRPVGETELLSPRTAFDRLKAGKCSDGEVLETMKPGPLMVTGYTLDYETDTKGFVRPVYAFTLELAGERLGRPITVPAQIGKLHRR